MPTVDHVRRRAEPTGRRIGVGAAATTARGQGGQGGQHGGDGERRPERPGDGVGHRVHQVVACPRHRVVALGAAVVELRGEVGHLAARRLVDGFTERPGDGDLVRERELGDQHRLGGAECRPFDPGDQARRQHRRDQRESEHEAGVAGTDGDGARPRTGGASGGTADASSTSCTRSNPTPQIANDTAAMTGAAPGTTARPANPSASSRRRRPRPPRRRVPHEPARGSSRAAVRSPAAPTGPGCTATPRSP